jgi:hypothetical protein
MKTILSFFYTLFAGFFYKLYQLAEAKFTLGFGAPTAASLRYFDNTNNVPAPQSVQSNFNNEPADVWLGYDAANCQLCITNYNRTVIICCIQPIPPPES